MKKEYKFYGKTGFTVQRLSNNIPLALPFVLFGSNDLNARYSSFLKTFNKGGFNIVGVNNNNGIIATPNLPYTPGNELWLIDVRVGAPGTPEGSILFSYEQLGTGLVDGVLVNFASATAYATFLQSLQTQKLSWEKVVMNISDVTLLGQLDQPILVGPISSAGLQEQVSFTPSTFQDPYDAVANAIRLELPNQKLTKQYGYIGFLQQNAGQPGYSVTITFDILEEIEK